MSRSSQFDERYPLPPRQALNPGVEKRRLLVIRQQRDLQAALRRRPTGIEWFEGILAGGGEGAAAAAADTRPRIGYFCNLVPTELIWAAGAVPVRLGCGNAALVQTGEEVLSGDICPLAKASFASLLDPASPASRCIAYVLPTSCDAKTKLGEILADYKPTFILNLPREQDPGRHTASMAADLDRLAAFLGQATGHKLSARGLLAQIRLGQEKTRLVRALQEVRSAQPAALSVRDLFVIIQAASAGADPEEWTRRVEQVLAEARTFKPERERIRPRLVLTGAPIIWPNFKALNLIEECGADVVADTLCTGAQSGFDPVVVEETGWNALLRALALRYIFASPCPCFISQGTRLTRVLELVKEHRARGVVNYSLRLCQLFDIEAYRLNQVLKDRKIPFLNLRTDYSLEDTEQLRVRLEAFLETL